MYDDDVPPHKVLRVLLLSSDKYVRTREKRRTGKMEEEEEKLVS